MTSIVFRGCRATRGKSGDSSSKTFMSDRGNVLSCVMAHERLAKRTASLIVNPERRLTWASVLWRSS